MRRFLQGLGHIIAPRVCRVCGQTLTGAEDVMCLKCLLDLPRTAAHKQPFNIIHQRLGHNAVVDRAAGWFIYNKQSAYARMLIDAKYASQPGIARGLGRMCAAELMADGFFDGIDALVPMPLHWTKQLRRGYNQAWEICRGINEATGLPIIRVLRAAKPHGVQSRLSEQERRASIAGTLALNRAGQATGKHLLFVDDIITTGATASEAVRTLYEAGPASVSVLCLGLTNSHK